MKDDILAAAQRLLRQGGYESLNFGSIAKELGITRANIHYHFGNKEGLAEAATAAYVQDWQDKLEALAQQSQKKGKGHFVRFMALLEEDLWREVEATDQTCGSICSQLLKNRAGLPTALSQLVDRHHARVLAFLETLIDETRRGGHDLAPGMEAGPLAREAMAIYLGALSMATALPGSAGRAAPARGVIKAWAERLMER